MHRNELGGLWLMPFKGATLPAWQAGRFLEFQETPGWKEKKILLAIYV